MVSYRIVSYRIVLYCIVLYEIIKKCFLIMKKSFHGNANKYFRLQTYVQHGTNVHDNYMKYAKGNHKPIESDHLLNDSDISLERSQSIVDAREIT